MDSEVIGVEYAAAALLLAAEKGRNGERYIISDRMMTAQELYETAADAAGTSVRLMHVMPRLDHGKAERELGWRPAPVHDSIRRAAEFYREHRRKLKAAQSLPRRRFGVDGAAGFGAVPRARCSMTRTNRPTHDNLPKWPYRR
jgi:hypothetical protein